MFLFRILNFCVFFLALIFFLRLCLVVHLVSRLFNFVVSCYTNLVIWIVYQLASPWVQGYMLRKTIRNFFYIDFLILKSNYFKTWNLTSKFQVNQRIFQFCDNTFIEIYWSSLPTLILITVVLLPSFSLLYFLDQKIPYEGNIPNDILTIKVIGRQWYWDYESLSFDPVTFKINKRYFSSYMIPTDDLYLGELRLLQVDNLLVLPRFKTIRFLITSGDVIHSWSVPALGIKVDACPGRLNQVWTYISRPGIFYGQCSEICGANHPFMPIMIQVF